MERVVSFALRVFIFLVAMLFVGMWGWFFITAMRAAQFSWSFWSLLLLAVFLLTLTIRPRGRASRVELGLASAKVLVDYEAPKEAEAVVERLAKTLPAELKSALERDRRKLLEEIQRSLFSISEKATVAALSSSSSAALTTDPSALTWSNLGSLTWADLEDAKRSAAIHRAIERRLAKKPTDPSSGSAR